LKEWNKLSSNPLSCAKSLCFQAEYELRSTERRTLRNNSSVVNSVERYYNEAISLLNDVMEESDSSLQFLIYYQLSVCFLGKAKNWILQQDQPQDNSHHNNIHNNNMSFSSSPMEMNDSQQAIFGNVVQNLLFAIEILEKMCLWLPAFLNQKPYEDLLDFASSGSEEEGNNASRSLSLSLSADLEEKKEQQQEKTNNKNNNHPTIAVEIYSKEFIYKHLQVPSRLSVSQELSSSTSLSSSGDLAAANTPLSQVLLSLLSIYEILSDQLRNKKYYFDCYLILIRNIQCISFFQAQIDEIEKKYHLHPLPSTNAKRASPSSMTITPPNNKRKNSLGSSFHVYSNNDLTTLMILFHKRQTICFFRLGVLYRNVQVSNKFFLGNGANKSVSKQSVLSEMELDNFSKRNSYFYSQMTAMNGGGSDYLLQSGSQSFDHHDESFEGRERHSSFGGGENQLFILLKKTLFQPRKETDLSYFQVKTIELFQESMINCLEKAGNDFFYLMEFPMSFQSLKLCGEILLEKYQIPSYLQIIDLLEYYRYASLGIGIGGAGGGSVVSEDAERVHDLWKLVKKSAEKVLLPSSSSSSSKSNSSSTAAVLSEQERVQYQIEEIIALYQAGTAIISSSFSNSSNNNHLAQRAIESAQSLQKDIESSFNNTVASSSSQNDFLLLSGDINYSLGFVYLRGGKISAAITELKASRDYYQRVTGIGSSNNTNNNNNSSSGEMVRIRLKHCYSLLAFIYQTVQPASEELTRVLEDYQSLFIGPVEGE
jgi:hypothetical protein